jgi:hypothetical protein
LIEPENVSWFETAKAHSSTLHCCAVLCNFHLLLKWEIDACKRATNDAVSSAVSRLAVTLPVVPNALLELLQVPLITPCHSMPSTLQTQAIPRK